MKFGVVFAITYHLIQQVCPTLVKEVCEINKYLKTNVCT